MQYAIITSKDCTAGKNIKENLLELFPFKEDGEFDSNPKFSYKDFTLYTINKHHIYAEHIDKNIPEDILIFATTHRSEKEVHSLSCHIPGNFGEAKFGGKKATLNISPCILLKQVYLTLLKHKDSVKDHDITLEVTHHGPELSKPVIFVEIGSSEKHWDNKDAGKAIAKTIIEAPYLELGKQQIAVGIGGTHYCASFNKILERTDIALGNICAKYNLEDLNEDTLNQAIEKNLEKVDFILVDWKGLGKYKEKVKDLLKDKEWKRTDKL